jgi:hypothetical protein
MIRSTQPPPLEHRRTQRARASLVSVLSALAAAIIPITIAPLPLHATVVVPVDVAELAVEAAAIAHGRIVRVEARQGEGRRVERLVTLQVFEYFKGGWGNVVQFRVPGGTLGRYQTVMIGTPEFAEGDEVVLFLGARAEPFVLGLHQGVFRVVAEEATGRRMVTPPLLQGASLTSRGRGDVNRRALDLREFQGRIAAALAAPRAAAESAPPAASLPAGVNAARPTAARVRERR